jgi:hypothetical protein
MKTTLCLAIFGILATGCSNAQPAFDPSVTVTKVIEGKKYKVPQGAKVIPHVATKKEIDFYKRSGVKSCKMGDVIWEEKGTGEKVAKAIRNGDATIHAKLAKEGKIGCASPIE